MRQKRRRLLYFILIITLSVYSVRWFWHQKSETTLEKSTASMNNYKEMNANENENEPQQQNSNSDNNAVAVNYYLSNCEHLYGKILILQFASDNKYATTTVQNALQTVRCYAELRGYELLQVIWNNGGNVQIRNVTDIKFPLEPLFGRCRQHRDRLVVLRHCVTRQLLVHYDYVIQIDADSGVVNPKRCFEEFIEPGIDVHLQLRFHTGEIQAGHYIVRNSTTSYAFLETWLQQTTGIFDQPFIQDAISERFLPQSDSEMCTKFKQFSYWRFVKCVVSSLRKLQENPRRMNDNDEINNKKKLLIYARAQGFARDGWLTDQKWADTDFMFHAMKEQFDVVYTRKLRDADCRQHPDNRGGIWGNYGRLSQTRRWKLLYVRSVDKMKRAWAAIDRRYFARKKQNAIENRISHCWPFCNHLVI